MKTKNKLKIKDIKPDLYANQNLLNIEFEKLIELYSRNNFLNKQNFQDRIIALKKELDNLEKNIPNDSELIFYRIKQR
jgi:hypothetical protein